jgi:uncharacterized phage-associated protein
MYSAAAIANVFLTISRENEKPITHMKLQKLTYISQGWSLALLDQSLFYDEIRAWQYGPVIPNLYEKLRKYGGKPIDEIIPLDPRQATVEPDCPEMALLKRVWDGYSKYSALTLSAITHRPETPWSTTWSDNPYGSIDDDVIKTHYLKLRDARLKPREQAA